MSTGTRATESDEPYYECAPCGYTASAGVAIGLCPRCGDRLAEQTR